MTVTGNHPFRWDSPAGKSEHGGRFRLPFTAARYCNVVIEDDPFGTMDRKFSRE